MRLAKTISKHLPVYAQTAIGFGAIDYLFRIRANSCSYTGQLLALRTNDYCFSFASIVLHTLSVLSCSPFDDPQKRNDAA